MRNRSITHALLAVASLLILLLSGCKSPTKVGTTSAKGETKTRNEFLESMEERAFRFGTMTARLNAELKIAENNVSSRVDLKMVKDSVILLSVQPFLGIEMFRAEFTVDSVRVIDRMNKCYVAESYADMKGEMPIDFNFYNLQALLTNRIFLPGEQSISQKQFGQFKLNQEASTTEIYVEDSLGLLYTFFADGEEKLLSTHISNASKQSALQCDYTDFRVMNKQVFPQLMDISFMSNNTLQTGISLRFSRIQTDMPVSYEFSIPAKYQRITFARILKAISNSMK